MKDLVDFTRDDIIQIGIKRLISDDLLKEMFEDIMNDLSVQIKAGKLYSYKTTSELFSNPYYISKMKNYTQKEYDEKFRLLLKLKGFYVNEHDKVTYKVV